MALLLLFSSFWAGYVQVDDLKRARREELLRKIRLRVRTAKKGGLKMSRTEVTETDVARIISKWTGR